MNEIIPYPFYSPTLGVRSIWYGDSYITVTVGAIEVVIEANRDGFLSLAGICANLAQNPMPNGCHIHLEPIFEMRSNSGSLLRIGELEKSSNASLIVERNDEATEMQSAFADETLSAAGLMLPDRPIQIIGVPRFKKWCDSHDVLDGGFQIDMRYRPWNEIGNKSISLSAPWGIRVFSTDDKELVIAGTSRGLLLLAAALVTIGQPGVPESAFLSIKVVDAKEDQGFSLVLKRKN